MPLMYKLVSQDYTTRNNTKWKIGKRVSASADGTEMCTNQVLHCYKNKYIAMIMNIYHADIANPRLIQVSCSKIIATDGLKYACKKQTMLKELLIPTITLEQKVHFSILCALEVYNAPNFIVWADSWINDIDRSYAAATAATAAAADAAAADAAATAADAARFTIAAAVDAAAATAAINRQNKIIDFSALINQIMNK